MLSTSRNSQPVWDVSWVSDRESFSIQPPPPRLLRQDMEAWEPIWRSYWLCFLLLQ